MKTFKEFSLELINDETTDYENISLDEGVLRNLSGVGLMLKLRSISNKIKKINFSKRDDDNFRTEKLMIQNELISQQNFYIGLLVTSLGIMKKDEK